MIESTRADAAVVTVSLPDVVPWGSADLFAAITGGIAIAFVLVAFVVDRLGKFGEVLIYYGPWLIAIGIWLALWELSTAKFGWLPKPFFSPPHGLLHVYVGDGQRLLICIGYTLRWWALGFLSGIVVGYAVGVALGWSKRCSHPAAIAGYWWGTFWIGVGSVSASLTVGSRGA